MSYDDAIAQLDRPTVSKEALDLAADAMAFVQSLHQTFADNGMTSSTEPDLNELENIIDAIYGELAAACIFLSEPSFARVPDMLRVVSKKLEGSKDEVPPVVVKGYERLAKRIENTRLHMQALVKNMDNSTPSA
jgi:hypothetical protein